MVKVSSQGPFNIRISGARGAAGVAGLPLGGTIGQALRKNSSTNGDASWLDVHEVPTGGTTRQALLKTSGSNYAYAWYDIHEVPAGGTTGQVLKKASGTDYALVWDDETGGGGGGATNLTDLLDVDADYPSDGDVLIYNTGTGLWENGPQTGGGGGGASNIVAKAYITFSSGGGITINHGLNIASFTEDADGRFTATFTSAIPAGCIVMADGRFGDNASNNVMIVGASRRSGEGVTTTAVNLVCMIPGNDGGAFDPYSGATSGGFIYFEVIDPSAALPGGGGGVASETLIERITTASSQASATFATIAGTYDDLKINILGRSNRSGSDNDQVFLQFNSDTGANYGHSTLYGFGGSTGGSTGTAESAGEIGFVGGATSQAGLPGMVEANIPRYADTVWKKVAKGHSMSVGTGAPLEVISGMYWNNTAAITDITVKPSGSNTWTDGTVIELIGITYGAP